MRMGSGLSSCEVPVGKFCSDVDLVVKPEGAPGGMLDTLELYNKREMKAVKVRAEEKLSNSKPLPLIRSRRTSPTATRR